MKTYKDWICRYYSEHEDGEEDAVIVQELIRCKDCIHNVANRETDPMDITDYSGEDIVCDYFMTDGQEPYDYCSRAERKPPQVNPEMVKALRDRIEKQRGEDAKRKS